MGEEEEREHHLANPQEGQVDVEAHLDIRYVLVELEEAKKAQNAKKIADRKAKKPPSDPPNPPAEPEAAPKVEELKAALEGAMAAAEAKLFEGKSAQALVAASAEDLLTDTALQDLTERARAEAHPTIAALEEACYVLGKDKTYEDMKARLEAPRGDDAEGGGLEEEPQASRRGFGVGEGARDFDEEEREALRGGEYLLR